MILRTLLLRIERKVDIKKFLLNCKLMLLYNVVMVQNVKLLCRAISHYLSELGCCNREQTSPLHTDHERAPGYAVQLRTKTTTLPESVNSMLTFYVRWNKNLYPNAYRNNGRIDKKIKKVVTYEERW